MSADGPIIRVHIKLIQRGAPASDITMEVPQSMPVDAFREKIAQTLNLPIDDFRIVFCGKILKPGTVLSEYSIEDGTAIQVVPGPNRSSSSPDPPAPPPQPQQPRVPLSENEEVFRVTCNIQKTLADALKELSTLQAALLNGTEDQARSKLMGFVTIAQSISTQLTTGADQLVRASGGRAHQIRIDTPQGQGNPFEQIQNMMSRMMPGMF